jgi:hypothetical protein
MPVQIIESSTTPEATYKAREVEGILDLYFYRLTWHVNGGVVDV